MKEILDMLVAYGTPLVITALVLYGAIRLMNIYIKKLEAASSPNKEKQRHIELLELRKTVDKTVNLILERALIRSGSDRVFIFEFHNGGENVLGLPFLRMTNTYEVVDTGIIPQKFNLQAMSLSMYSALISKIIEKTYIVLRVDQREPDIPAIVYETLIAQGIHTCVLVRILDPRDRPIGYAGMDYTRTGKRLDVNRDINTIVDTATEVGALLAVDDELDQTIIK